MIIRQKLGYIANRINVENKGGIELGVYDTPYEFHKNYMPLSDSDNLQTYGENVNRTLRMFVKANEWYGKIKVNDRAYLIDSDTSEEQVKEMVGEANKYCTNANYRVSVANVQNFMMKIEFTKISEGE